MQYLLMIHADQRTYEALDEAALMELLAAYNRFGAELRAAGKHLGSNRLQPATTGTIVRVRAGALSTVDGPFAETKEQIGGYYLIEAQDHDEAIAWAAKLPSAAYGAVEVRPVWPPTVD